MDALPDLTRASREDLLAVITRQQQTIAGLLTQVATLTARVQALEDEKRRGGPMGRMPGTKPTEAAATPPRPRKPRGLAFVRRRSRPTHTVTHAPEQCPDCGTALTDGWVQRTREVIELVVPPARVTEHRFLARTCPACRRRVVAQPDLSEVVVGRQRLGVGVQSVITTLREEFRLPVAAIRRLLATLHGLRLSAGSIVAASQRVAAAGAGLLPSLQEQVRAAPVLHADETGWRENGTNGYVWTLTTPTTQLFVHGRRSAAAFHAALGGAYAGTLVSDFYGVYAAEDGPHQWCWAHLLRDIHSLTERFPEDGRLTAWATAVHQVYTDARAAPTPSIWQRGAVLTAWQDRLMTLCTPFLDDGTAPQRTLCRRMETFLGGLFTFVVEPDVPPDNNRAERSLRHLVTARKISGGTRSAAGTATKMTLASLFGTWRVQGVNPLRAARALLLAPRP